VSNTLLFPQDLRLDVSLQLSTAQVWHLCRLADLADQLPLGAERDKMLCSRLEMRSLFTLKSQHV